MLSQAEIYVVHNSYFMLSSINFSTAQKGVEKLIELELDLEPPKGSYDSQNISS
jgi:hypothetical protein